MGIWQGLFSILPRRRLFGKEKWQENGKIIHFFLERGEGKGCLLYTSIPAVALLSRQNPLSSRRDIRLEDLPTRRLVTYENFEYEDWLGMLGIPASANVLYIFDRGGLLDAVRKDNYMAVVMYDPQQRELSDCVTLPITGFSDTLDVCLMRSKSYTLNAREKKFVQFCKKRFQTAHEI